MGLEGQVEVLEQTLRLLVGLILSCLLLLLLLGGSFLLGWRPDLRGLRGSGCSPPTHTPHTQRLFPVARPKGATTKQLLPPLSSVSCGRGRRAAPTHGSAGQTPRAGPPFCTPAQQRGWPMLVPPNSPVTSSSGTGGAPEGALSRSCPTSTREKRGPSGASSAAAPHPNSVPFEYSSSIRGQGRRRAQPLDSANFTASQGPGLDTDFGASAGVSVRILSSDSEGSPGGSPFLHHPPSARFEWDYYDPSFERKAQLSHHPPPIGSKQYWL